MNRLLIPMAVAALLAGCTLPAGFGQQSNQPAVADPPQTTIVREVHYIEPVVYHDTVYVPEQTTSSEPVYAGDEYNTYNEYNQYNETSVYVHEHVVMPPPPRHDEQRWSPRDRGQQPRDRSGYDKPPERRNQPNVPMPKPPVKRTYAPVANDRQNAPVPPTPPYQPVQPKRQAPAQGGVPVAPMPHENPRQVPTPPADKSPSHGSDAVQGQAATDQAGTGLVAARSTK